jgi:hypothetical protein
MTTIAIPSRELLKSFKDVMEKIMQGVNVNFTYKGDTFTIVKNPQQSNGQKTASRMRALLQDQPVDNTPYESNKELYKSLRNKYSDV